jgi:hypothetical protein
MSSTTSKPTKASALTQVQALIAGTQKHFPNGSFTLGNAPYTAAALIQMYQNLGNALIALATAHVQLKEAGLTVKAGQAQVGPVIQDYKRFLLSSFSTAPQTLADFGLQPPKVRKPLTSDQRAVAKAKVTATRTARGTTSKKQKLAIKGDVTSVNITPVKVAPVTQPPAAPAASTPVISAPSAATK